MKTQSSYLLMLFAFCFFLFSCSEEETSQPAENVCDRVTVSNNQPAVRMDCNSISGSVSGITYDQFGRVTSFNFDWKCTNSSEQYSGRFHSITYNSIGQIQSFQATVNGKNCSWPR
jgi:hypothetical protein